MTWKMQVPARLPRANPAPRPDASFGEVVGAAFDNETIDADINDYGARVEMQVLHEVVDRLGPAALPPSVVEGLAYPRARPFKRSRADLLAAAAEAERKNPAAWGDLPTSDAAVTAEGARRRSAEAADNMDTLSMGGGGIGQMAAEFIGAGATVFTDPIQAPLMFLGAGTGRLGRTIAIEAGLGAGGELVTLPARARVADELDRPDLTPGAMAAQVAGGAVFGAGFGALAHGAQRGAAYLAGRTDYARSTAPRGIEPGDHGAAIDEAETALREGRPVPTPAPVTTRADIARVTSKIIGVESGGRATAQNPNSSAGGLGQIVDGTWLELIERERPDLWSTKTRAEILAMKSDPVLNRAMTEANTATNKTRLEDAGFQATDGNLYLAHFLGPGGAVRALLEDPAAPIGKVMSADAIAANKGVTFAGRPIQHWTVQDLRRWSEAKMGQGVDPGAAYTAATRRGYTSGDEVVTPAGTRVSVEYEVVDIDTLTLASRDRQPRDRSRAAPTAKVKERAAALDPAQLLPSPLAGSGAPVVGADGIIDSGNGRTMSIMHARENFPDRYAAYLEAMRAAGFDIADGQMLIARRTSDLGADDLRKFVREANDDVVERMSPSEQARADAGALTDEALGLYDPEAGGVGAGPNKGFLTKVVDGLPASQQGSVMDGQGRLTPAGATRIQAALLARAFDAPDLIEAATESAGAEIKSLLDALTDVAPAWAQMRAAAKAGGIDADFDITPQLVEAVRLIREARATSIRDGIPVRAALVDALAQGDMFAGGVDPITARLVGIAYDGGRARSRDAVAGALRDYIAEARKIGGDGGGLLDAIAPTGPLDILDGARARLESAPPDAPGAGDAPAPREAGPAGVSVIDVDAVDDALWTDGAMAPAAQAGADEAEAALRAQIGGTADAAAPDPARAAILDAGDFEAEPGVTAGAFLDDLDADAEFAEIVSLCGIGGQANG